MFDLSNSTCPQVEVTCDCSGSGVTSASSPDNWYSIAPLVISCLSAVLTGALAFHVSRKKSEEVSRGVTKSSKFIWGSFEWSYSYVSTDKEDEAESSDVTVAAANGGNKPLPSILSLNPSIVAARGAADAPTTGLAQPLLDAAHDAGGDHVSVSVLGTGAAALPGY